MSSEPSSHENVPAGRTESRTLFGMLAAALVVRVALGSFIDTSGFDTDLMQSWTRTFLDHPPSEFYAVAEGPDHLPGDLWLLWLIGHGLELFGFEGVPRGPFVALMKLVPAIADVAIALALFALVRRFATPRAALLTAAAFAFNPASVFLTSIWGQWDSLSMALLLGGMLVILRTVPAMHPPPSTRRPLPSSQQLRRSLSMGRIRSIAARLPMWDLGSASPRSAAARRGPGLRHLLGPRASSRDPSPALGMTEAEAPTVSRHPGQSEEPVQAAHRSKAWESPGEAGPGSGRTVSPGTSASPGDPSLTLRMTKVVAQPTLHDHPGERVAGTETRFAGNLLPRWPLAVPLLTWAVLIKPPLALLAGVLVLFACVQTVEGAPAVWAGLGRAAGAVAASLVLGIATACLILLPFDVGLPGMPARWDVLERARHALDLYPATTLQAPNVWMLKDAELFRPSDVDGTWIGLTERSWGLAMLAAALAWIAWVVVRCWRSVPDVLLVHLLVWVMLAAAYAAFMLPTRVHERYFFPVLVLALAFAGLPARRDGDLVARWLALAVAVVFLLTLLAGYDVTARVIRSALFGVSSAAVLRALAVANAVLFVVTMTLPLRWDRVAEGTRRSRLASRHIREA